MTRLIFSLLALSLLSGACEKKEKPNILPPVADQQLLDATNEMTRLIDDGADFDVAQIKWGDYWYLDAKMKYNDDFSMVTEVVSAIGGAPWHQERELVVCINDGVVKSYELSDSGDVVVAQQGVFDFYSRILTLYVDLEAQRGYEAISIEAKLLSYTDDSFIIEWQTGDGCFRALFKRIDYSVLECRGAEIKINDILAEMGEFVAEDVAEQILGGWVGDTRLEYDSADYASICRIDALLGDINWTPYPPGFGGVYTFSGDGTLTNVVVSELPSEDTFTYTYRWSYDADTNILSVEDDKKSMIYTVIALSDEWLFVDYEVVGQDSNTGEVVTKYLREGYRRVVK